MRLFSSKRGEWIEEQFKPIFWLILLGALVFITLMAWIFISVPEQTKYEKNFLARDLALTFDAAQAAPDNIAIRYTNTGLFSFIIKEDQISVLDETGGLNPSPIKHSTYSFNADQRLSHERSDIIRPEGIPIKEDVEPTKATIVIAKTGDTFHIKDNTITPDLDKATTTQIDTYKERATIVILTDNLEKNKETINAIKTNIPNHEVIDHETDNVNPINYKEKLSQTNLDLVIITALDETRTNHITAEYYQNAESTLLAKNLKLISLLDAPVTTNPTSEESLNNDYPTLTITHTRDTTSQIAQAVIAYFEK